MAARPSRHQAQPLTAVGTVQHASNKGGNTSFGKMHRQLGSAMPNTLTLDNWFSADHDESADDEGEDEVGGRGHHHAHAQQQHVGGLLSVGEYEHPYDGTYCMRFSLIRHRTLTTNLLCSCIHTLHEMFTVTFFLLYRRDKPKG